MRTLKFIVNGQKLSKDPNCDFSGIVAGTKGYLKAEFIFSDEWKDLIKVLGYSSNRMKEDIVFIKDDSILIPESILGDSRLIFRITGVRSLNSSNDLTIVTNKVRVTQEGGR